MESQAKRKYYDKMYSNINYFNYKRWMFVPYIGAIIGKFGIDKDALILDIGCGTGLFTSILHDHKLKSVGLDFSEVGIKAARTSYNDSNIFFLVGDATALPFADGTYDVIFCRDLSLYGVDNLPSHIEITEQFVRHLKKGGLFINCLSTDGSGIRNSPRRRLIGKKDTNWINHTLADIYLHFELINISHIVGFYFVNRLDLLLFRKFGLNWFFSIINRFLCKLTGIRGEAICVVKKL
jgi:SAM-dependent methyltransferase